MWTTSIPNNPGDYDFKKYSVFAVFYKGHQGYSATVGSVQESPAGKLSATVAVDCYNPSLCAAPLRLPILGGSTSSSRSTSARW